MLLRLLVAVLALVAGLAPAADANEGISTLDPPSTLASRLKDGEIPDNEWTWMRGAFAGATPAQLQEWRDIEIWIRDCTERDVANARKQLSAMGIPQAVLPGGVSSTRICTQAKALKGAIDKQESWEQFNANMTQAGRILDTYLFGAINTIRHSPYDAAWADNEGWQILRASAYDQALRSAFSWNVAAGAPKLPESLERHFRAQLTSRTASQDFENTRMLKGFVAASGWPKRSRSVAVSEAAWLLTQHADQDPVYQLDMLRKMEPLVAAKEVSSQNYAYLYDRIMLKLTGMQRYGTQFDACKDGERPLRPLEPNHDLAKDRIQMGLITIEEYKADMTSVFGACPR